MKKLFVVITVLMVLLVFLVSCSKEQQPKMTVEQKTVWEAIGGEEFVKQLQPQIINDIYIDGFYEDIEDIKDYETLRSLIQNNFAEIQGGLVASKLGAIRQSWKTAEKNTLKEKIIKAIDENLKLIAITRSYVKMVENGHPGDRFRDINYIRTWLAYAEIYLAELLALGAKIDVFDLGLGEEAYLARVLESIENAIKISPQESYPYTTGVRLGIGDTVEFKVRIFALSNGMNQNLAKELFPYREELARKYGIH